MTPMINERKKRSNDTKRCFETSKNENRKSGKRKKNEKRKTMRKSFLSLIKNRQSNQALMELYRLYSKILDRMIL